MEIKPITIDLIDACAKLYMEVLNKEPWNDEWTYDTAYKRLMDCYQTLHFIGLAYMDHGQVKGMIFGNYEIFYKGIHYNLKEMILANNYQRQGIGSLLMKEIEETLKPLGITKIYLLTSKDNHTNEFYQKNDYYEYSDLVIMAKDI